MSTTQTYYFFFFSSRRRHTRLQGDWSSDVCSSDLMAEAREVCDYIEGAGSPNGLPDGRGERLLRLFREKMSPGFDPEHDLVRVGVANQTTMLSGESLAIAAELRRSMATRYGEAALAEHFRNFG